MKKYPSIIFIFSIILFGLTGCAHIMHTFRTNDPDGDKDSKGANHFPLSRTATGQKVFIFDPKVSAFAVYDEYGYRMNTGKASGGNNYCPDTGRACRTITGRFRVLSKGSDKCISHSFPIETNGGAPMPYCMHFARNYAIHGSPSVPNYNASHGCIRVTPTVAEWLNKKFMNVGSTVIVLPYA